MRLILCTLAILAVSCSARIAPRRAVALRRGAARPLLALRLRGGAEEEASVEEPEEVEAEAVEDEPEVEEPADAAEEVGDEAVAAPAASGPMLLGLDLGMLRQRARGLLGMPAEDAAAAEEGGNDLMSTVFTLVVFIAARVLLGLTMRFLRQPAAEGVPTPIERLAATPLGPLVKAVQGGWAKVAELSRSPYAAVVVLTLCIGSIKMINAQEEARAAEEEAVNAAASEEEPAVEEEPAEEEEQAAEEEEPAEETGDEPEEDAAEEAE